jgi:hypothetical protein
VIYYLIQGWLYVRLWFAEWDREHAFDRLRDTGGESSPWLEDYERAHAEQWLIEKQIRKRREAHQKGVPYVDDGL